MVFYVVDIAQRKIFWRYNMHCLSLYVYKSKFVVQDLKS